MKSGRTVSQAEVDKFVDVVDTSKDGKIQKPELFESFKKVLSGKSFEMAPYKSILKLYHS